MREVIFLVLRRSLKEFLERIAPTYLESDWDNSGPQVELDRKEVEGLLIGLDTTLELVERGAESGADLLITHHPLIFSELGELDAGSPTGKKLEQLVRSGTGLFSVHTPFDRSARGLSYALAKRLELDNLTPLDRSKSPKLLKLTVYVPKPEEETVRESLIESGAGNVGNYRGSYYSSPAEESFTPTEAADPEKGRTERPESSEVTKLEFLLRPKYRGRVLATLDRVHPYEEPGFSVEEVERRDPAVGLGRLGEWDTGKDLTEVKDLVADRLEVGREELTVTGELTGEVRQVGASPGAGGAAIEPAINAGLDLLITGELDYHERLEAEERGLVVVEAGHFHSEKVFVPWLEELLREEYPPETLEIDLYGEGKGR